MRISIDRKWKKPNYTISNLYVDGKRFTDGKQYCNVLEDTDRGLTSDMTVDQILKKKVYGQTAIPKGEYVVTITYSTKFKRDLPLLNAVKGFTGVRIHCLDEDTEVLTVKGWKGIDSYNGEELITYNRATKEYEVLPNIEKVERYHDGYLWGIDGRRGVNFLTTDKHNHWVGVHKRNGGYEWQTRHADDIPTGAKYKVSGKNNKERLSPNFLLLYKVAFATVADGYIRKYKQGSCNVVFHFRKERKVAKIVSYLEELEEKYSMHENCDGTKVISLNTEFSYTIAQLLDEPDTEYRNYKLFPYAFYDLASEDLLELLDTYMFFDGKFANHFQKHGCRIINSANLQRIEQLQAFAVLAGCSTYLCKTHGQVNGWELRYTPCEEKLCESRPEKIPYKGRVWCLSNDNETLIIRRNGRTMITQNCGNSAKDTLGCIILGRNDKVGWISNSRYWFGLLFDKIDKAIKRGEKVTFVIE